MEKRIRKKIRLDNYDYSSVGAYYLTLCVSNHRNIFWDYNEGMTQCDEALLPLSEYGKIVNEAIDQISVHYPDVYVDRYVIMPNHLHLILIIGASEGINCKNRDISLIINQFKGYISKRLGKSIWQKSYFDHIIRGEHDYKEICNYIANNPSKWEEVHYT